MRSTSKSSATVLNRFNNWSFENIISSSAFLIFKYVFLMKSRAPSLKSPEAFKTSTISSTEYANFNLWLNTTLPFLNCLSSPHCGQSSTMNLGSLGFHDGKTIATGFSPILITLH